MDDVINRQTSIDAIRKIDGMATLPDGDTVIRKSAVEYVLLHLPSAQPEPQSRMVFGYPLEYLVAFAEACRRAGVDESDLKTFANNCEFAYATMEEEHRQHINQAIEAFMGNAGGKNASD